MVRAVIVNIHLSDYNLLSQPMKYQIPFRIIVSKPLAGVAMRVQSGKDQLLLPSPVSESSMSFEFDVTVDVNDVVLNFLGKYAQGPKDARFVYVNSGTQAGQSNTCWSRRAKLSLMSITREQVQEVIDDPKRRLEATMLGTGRDGGPTCATVKGIEWKVVRR